MATLPLAPVRFSITIVQPCASCRPCATSRAEMSGAPPGGMVTSMRIGRDGYGACALAPELVRTLVRAALVRAMMARITQPIDFIEHLPWTGSAHHRPKRLPLPARRRHDAASSADARPLRKRRNEEQDQSRQADQNDDFSL